MLTGVFFLCTIVLSLVHWENSVVQKDRSGPHPLDSFS